MPDVGWKNLGEKPIVETPWFQLKLAEVELPGGRQLDHYLLRLPPLVLTAGLDDEDRVLLLWRHRFIPDSWGWELPSGIADPGEDLAAAAARSMRPARQRPCSCWAGAAPPSPRRIGRPITSVHKMKLCINLHGFSM
ncbi:MAG TPA: NUDIX domain-containing protein [Streptosporangiaceae bacterium]|jgi:hypothetical protein|nr:NUDIX domain-containing protein [Streptosporangiaceae bacterium]